jgi:hypothetical protein
MAPQVSGSARRGAAAERALVPRAARKKPSHAGPALAPISLLAGRPPVPVLGAEAVALVAVAGRGRTAEWIPQGVPGPASTRGV